MNILFICTFNKYRSLTAEHICKHVPRLNVRSAGTVTKARRIVTKEDINWADKIYVMEREHQEILLDRFPTQSMSKIIIDLEIEDVYPYMDPELIEILKASIEEYVAQ